MRPEKPQLAPNPIVTKPWTVTTPDGVALAATVFEPLEAVETVLVLPGIGIRQTLYRHYAAWLAERGLRVVTVDYRGVGASRIHASAAVDLATWGVVDIPAVFRAVRDRFETPVVLSHSFGGQALGLADVLRDAKRIMLVAAGSADWRLFEGSTRRAMIFWFHLLFPIVSRVYRVMPKWAAISAGLPAPLARQWAAWGRKDGWLTAARPESLAVYAAVDVPMRAYSFTDDQVAPRRAVDALLGYLAGADVEHLRIAPAQLSVPTVGHAGFFKPGIGDSLWEQSLEFLSPVPPLRVGVARRAAAPEQPSTGYFTPHTMQ